MNKAQFDHRISSCLLDFIKWLRLHNIEVPENTIKEFCGINGIEYYPDVDNWYNYLGQPK